MNIVPQGPENAPITVYAESPWDPNQDPIRQIGIGSGIIAVHHEVIANMPETDHVTVADCNAVTFAALGLKRTETKKFFMPTSTEAEIDTGASVVSHVFGYPNRRGLAQALYAHGVFKNVERGAFPDLAPGERSLLELLATGESAYDAYDTSGLGKSRSYKVLRALKSATGIEPLPQLIIAADNAGEIDITRHYKLPPSMKKKQF